MIVEYMLEQVGRGDAKRAPSFIRDGGHWFNQADYTYLGWVPNLAEREFYVPDSLTVMDRANTISRALTMHTANPFMSGGADPDSEMTEMTDAEVTTMVGDWWDNIVSQYQHRPESIYLSYAPSSNKVEAKVVFTRKGIVVTGNPQLTVSVGGVDTVLSYNTKNYNSMYFSATQSVAEGTTISIDTATASISLNGGTITDGTDNVVLSLADTENNADSLTV